MLRRVAAVAVAVCAFGAARGVFAQGAPLGGFVPLVGIGLTREFDLASESPSPADPLPFSFADRLNSRVGVPMGPGGVPYYDFALLDTGAATHILRQDSASASGFGTATPFSGETDGFIGTQDQIIFGASGPIVLQINDPLGIYMAGLANATSNGATLSITNPGAMRGQSSFALLQATDDQWTLPNIIGLPMAAQHGIAIRNSEPVIFEHGGRTVRTPNIDLIPRGSGEDENILRRSELTLRPSAGFLQGPAYLQTVDFNHILNGKFHEDPLTPTVVENGGLYIEVDLARGTNSFQDKELLFDTGADLTVLSRQTAKRLGFDALVDEPDFVLEVEGAGGVRSGVPVIYLDELNLDTIGGSFTLQNVPVLVLDLPNPADPANVVDGILGMNVFTGRDIVIDANPAASSTGGGPPTLFISDPVAETHQWATNAASGNWATSGNWSAAGTPNIMWDANVANVSGSHQIAVVSADSDVYRMTVSGTAGASMRVLINNNAKLTTFGEVLIRPNGRIELAGGNLDAHFVNIEGGVLAGEGEVFVGTGPLAGQVRNLSGRIEPGDPVGLLTIEGDLSQQKEGTLAIDLGGTTAVTQHDQLDVGRFAFLGGTLQVFLVNLGGGAFVPAVGNTFTILTADDVNGTFDNLSAPSGFEWDLTYNPTSVVLSVTGIGAAGDYNHDGTVNAADYTVWRNSLGTSGPDADGNHNGMVDTGDYLVWKNAFGMGSGSGSAIMPGAVPEPTTLSLILLGVFAIAICKAGRSR
jgi:hypothetical protein